MLRRADRREHAADWGVDELQIERDAAISHILAGWNDAPFAGGVFIGGTALSRTVLAGYRLSEDIDVITRDAKMIAVDTADWVSQHLRSEYRHVNTTVQLSGSGATWQVMVDIGDDGYALKLELIDHDDFSHEAPKGLRPVELRYAELPDHIDLPVPENNALVAMKLSAWADRATARDLADLHGLALATGGFEPALLDTARRHGIYAAQVDWTPPAATSMDEGRWADGLAGQMKDMPPLNLAWLNTRASLAEAAAWDTATRWREEADERLADIEMNCCLEVPAPPSAAATTAIRGMARTCGVITMRTGLPCERIVAAHSRTCGIHWCEPATT